jgi:hypothetical protein
MPAPAEAVAVDGLAAGELPMPLMPPVPGIVGDGEPLVRLIPLMPPMALMLGEGDADAGPVPPMPFRKTARTWSGV